MEAEVTRYPGRWPRDNARFAITDLQGPQTIHESAYSWRGHVENRNSELRNAMRIAKTSCCAFESN